MKNQIPCPDCHQAIPVDTELLLQGHQFICGHCGLQLALAPASRPMVAEVYTQFERLLDKQQCHQSR